MSAPREFADALITRGEKAAKAFSYRAVLVVTLDIDWASEDCIADVLDMLASRGIRPTCFATHLSNELNSRLASGSIDIGLHPNFLAGSSHGTGEKAVFEHLAQIYPGATGFRSHSFADSSPVSLAAVNAGMQYDSNTCAFLSERIVPIWHWLGFWRFPVFWEDDIHWTAIANWELPAVRAAVIAPGLKIVNLHPFNQALNIPTGEFYAAHKALAKTIDTATIGERRHPGAGCRTFAEALLDEAQSARLEFMTMNQLVSSVTE
jgi:hypothetical protein